MMAGDGNMDSDLFERRMRELEYFHALRLLPGTWTVVRVDGRGFSRFTEQGFEKPFDSRFHDLMVSTATTLLQELNALYAYTESDEISVLCPRAWDMFDRELEKIVSVTAGIASAAFTHAAATPAHFDSRVWLGADAARVADYFRWRETDALRCALNGWCYWTLRQAGRTVRQATAALDGRSVASKRALLLEHGITFDDLPAWQRRGSGLYWEEYQKEGYNPVRDERVVTTRRRVKVDRDLPAGDEYGVFIGRFLDPM